MTEQQKLATLKLMIDDSSASDDLLSVFLELAADKILNRMYPFKSDYTGLKVPDRYVSIQLKVSAYLYGKIGAEGQIQHIENGIHRNYGSADIPNDMLVEIVPFAQVIR